MKKLLYFIALSMLVEAVWATGNTCTLTKSVALSISGANCGAGSTHSCWTGTGCTADGYVPNNDNIVLGAFNLTVDQNASFGLSGSSYLAYVSSITPTDTTDTICTAPATLTSACSGGCGGPYYGTSVTPTYQPVASGGKVTSVPNKSYNSNYANRWWGQLGSTTPTVSGGQGTNCTGATYTVNFVASAAATAPARAAVLFNNAASVVTINPGITLTLQGWGLNAAAEKWIMKNGSKIALDNSTASDLADGLKPIYALFGSQNQLGGGTYYLDTSDCTTAAPCTIDGNPNGTNTNNIFSMQGNVNSGPGSAVLAVGDLSNNTCAVGHCVLNLKNLGGPMDDTIWFNDPGVVRWHTGVGSTATNSGTVNVTAATAGALIQFSMIFNSTLGRSDFYFAGASTPTGSGYRTMSNVVSASPNTNTASWSTSNCNNAGTSVGALITNSYFNDLTGCFALPLADSTVGTFSYNFMRATTVGGTSVAWGTGARTRIGNYFMLDQNNSNVHMTATNSVSTVGNQPVITGEICDPQEQPDNADHQCWEPGGSSPSSSDTVTLTNSLMIPTKNGLGAGWLAPNAPNTPQANAHWAVNHMFWQARSTINGSGSSPTENSALAVDHAPGPSSSTMASYKSNLFYNPTSNVGTLAFKIRHDTGSASYLTDICTNVTCDYNHAFNFAQKDPACAGCSNAGRSYSTKFSSSGALAGAHDIDHVIGNDGVQLDPYLVDMTRNINWFDQRLGVPVGTAWSGSGTYGIGDVVSDSKASVYNNKTLNYRSKVAQAETTIMEPDLLLNSVNGHVLSMIVSGGVATLNVDVNHNLLAGQLIYIFGPSYGTAESNYKTITTVNTGCTSTSYCVAFASGLGSGTYVAGFYVEIWRNFWEYNSLYVLRQAVGNGLTFSGTTRCTIASPCGAVQFLNDWVVDGYIAQSPWLVSAGHDGHDIGPADPIVTRHVTPAMWIQ